MTGIIFQDNDFNLTILAIFVCSFDVILKNTKNSERKICLYMIIIVKGKYIIKKIVIGKMVDDDDCGITIYIRH